MRQLLSDSGGIFFYFQLASLVNVDTDKILSEEWSLRPFSTKPKIKKNSYQFDSTKQNRSSYRVKYPGPYETAYL